ncbi:MAG: YCII-related domain protein [Planctomycetaceae bacterium]|nr:YCII-related domain protein [Planctomycetaceae bacterium]
METSTSSYMLLFRDTTPDIYAAMSPDQREQCMLNFYRWHDGLEAAGKMGHAHPLIPAGRVVSMPRGGRIVDGPFSEAKETIGGYFLIYVSGEEEAVEIARQCPSLQFGMTVEVRPVAAVCPLAGTSERPPVARQLESGVPSN